MAVETVRAIRHRPETLREQNLRLELAEAHRDAIAFCDRVEPSLHRLHGATVHIGPLAEQLAAKAIFEVRRYRDRNR